MLAVLLLLLQANDLPPIADKPDLMQLGWMSGCWVATNGEAATEEQWTRPVAGTLIGIAREIKGGVTTTFEHMHIREVAGWPAYVVIPWNQKETVFQAVRLSSEEARFVNEGNAFPQRIHYRRIGNAMSARIEGTLNGEARAVQYDFKRCS